MLCKKLINCKANLTFCVSADIVKVEANLKLIIQEFCLKKRIFPL